VCCTLLSRLLRDISRVELNLSFWNRQMQVSGRLA
jgi:hypothetical protein